MNRYKELKKENDQLLNELGDSYQRIATIYVKKARGYAVRNEDTEVKIRDTLFILKKHSDDGAICSVAIANESEFIESRVALLSKQYKDPDMIKGAIILTVLIILGIAWYMVGQYISRKVAYSTPQNINITVLENNKIEITWNKVMYANEYTIYYIVDENTSAMYKSEENKYTFELEKNKEYTFYIYVPGNNLFKQSETASYTFKLE